MPEKPGNILSLNRNFNPNAQFSLGATVFVDPKATTPATGGGVTTATVALARTITTPLDGIASFLYTAPTAAQGQGWQFEVPIQPADWTKVFTLKYDYQITTGAYLGAVLPVTGSTFSDITMWIYSAGSATYIEQFSNWQVDGTVNTTNQYSYQGSWQCPQGATFARVIFYQGNASNAAFTARFNNISFGREPRVQGNIDTPMVGYTASFNGFGTVTPFDTKFSRNGIWSYTDFTFTAGTVAASPAWISMPPGTTVDSIALSTGVTTHVIGQWVRGSSAGTNAGPMLAATGISTNIVYFSGAQSFDAGGLFPLNIPNGSAQFSTGDVVRGWFRVPVTGWGANGTLGQDADVRVIGCYYQNTGGTSYGFLPSGAVQSHQVASKIFDDGMNATFGIGVTFAAFAPVAGNYQVSAGLYSIGVAMNANNLVQMAALVNGATIGSTFGVYQIASKVFDAAVTQSWFLFGTSPWFKANAGDRINIYAATSGTATAVIRANVLENYIGIQRQSGPAQVQAPEVITAAYTTNAGQSISNNTLTIVDFEDKEYDDHGCVTTGAAWKFTCPRAGRVSVEASIFYTATAGWAAGEYAGIFIYVSGVNKREVLYTQVATHSQDIVCQIAGEVTVNAGDYIDIRTQQNSGGTVALSATSTRNYVNISYVGGITQ